jgi:hypothetical protein
MVPKAINIEKSHQFSILIKNTPPFLEGTEKIPLHKVGGFKYKWFKKTLEPFDSANTENLYSI